MSKAALIRDVHARWPELVAKAGIVGARLPSGQLFSKSTKTEKGIKRGVLTRVLYLAPDSEAFDGGTRTLCPFASKDCSSVCLGHSSGLLATSTAKIARRWRTALYMGDRQMFRSWAQFEITAHLDAARRKKLIPAIRFDGSSDTSEDIHFAKLNPSVQFYGYTKNPHKLRTYAAGKYPSNYHLTFSYSGANSDDCREAIALGVNVAVVFDTVPRPKPRKSDPLPESLWGAEVLDGDELNGDARFLDPTGGLIVGLRFKAAKARRAAIDRAGAFVVRTLTTFNGAPLALI